MTSAALVEDRPLYNARAYGYRKEYSGNNFIFLFPGFDKQLRIMKHSVAVDLIKGGVVSRQAAHWADLGAGTGVFTKALAALLSHPESIVFAVDRDVNTLNQLAPTNPMATVIKLGLDFVSDELPLHNLDGILMANSLHFVQDKLALIWKLKRMMKPSGVLIIVEYDTSIPSPWVPYPISFALLKKFMMDNGFASVTRLGDSPSIYHQQGLYAALVTPLDS